MLHDLETHCKYPESLESAPPAVVKQLIPDIETCRLCAGKLTDKQLLRKCGVIYDLDGLQKGENPKEKE
jgi:hypothetical protein